MKTITLTLILTFITVGVFSQDFEVPKNYKFDKAEDYGPYEQDVLKCIDWLMKTPINEQLAKRNEVNSFLSKWLSGCPNVDLYIKKEIVTFMDTSRELLNIYVAGWAKYSLESKDFKNKKAGTIAGIESVIDFYTKNRDFMKKDKNVEKYIKLSDKGKLKAFVEKNA
jgi:hypothetical protein